jgi:hypothetical protein
MKKPGLRLAFLAVAILAAVASASVLLWPKAPWSPPLALSFVRTEPSGMFDDRGLESWLVTLKITNFDRLTPSYGTQVYFRSTDRLWDVKMGNRWVPLPGNGHDLNYSLLPGGISEQMILVPAGTQACRFSLKCTRAKLVDGRLAWLAERLPRAIGSRIPPKVWRWLGFTTYGPSSDGRTLDLELPISPLPVTEAAR